MTRLFDDQGRRLAWVTVWLSDALYLGQDGERVIVQPLTGHFPQRLDRLEVMLPPCDPEDAVPNHCWLCGDWQWDLSAGEVCMTCQETADLDAGIDPYAG